ncbi:MAG: Holliday junction branch migration protein RuvA [Planctomycetota bacterium]
MIARLTGQLIDLVGETAYVDPGQGLVYEALLPAFAATRLSVKTGQTVTLHTLNFIEATSQGATLFPRLAGFLTLDDKRFFELFVTCKGIGHRRALRAMVLDPATLAAAIADRDAKLIQTMPEVGKKLAETIVLTLRDKVEPFVAAAAYPEGAEGPRGQGAKGVYGETPERGAITSGGLAREALEVLLQLGENRTDAVRWIDRVLAIDADDGDRPDDVQDVVAAVYRLKAGA